jgi:hypothetical protein
MKDHAPIQMTEGSPMSWSSRMKHHPKITLIEHLTIETPLMVQVWQGQRRSRDQDDDHVINAVMMIDRLLSTSRQQ